MAEPRGFRSGTPTYPTYQGDFEFRDEPAAVDAQDLTPTKWIASINSTALDEFPEWGIAMPRVEELIESSMVLVLHDWELYRAEKAKR